MLKDYEVSCSLLYTDIITAESKEEAVKILEDTVPYDIDGEVHVVEVETGDEWDL